MSAQLDALRNKVQRILADEFGTIEVDKNGDFTMQFESARAFVRCFDWVEDQTIVAVEAPVLFNVQASPELYKYVATEGGTYMFGHLHLRELSDGNMLLFEHNLLGDFLDAAELKRTLVAVLGTANRLDDELQTKFGGRRFHEDG